MRPHHGGGFLLKRLFYFSSLQHFSELLDDLSQDALLGQLLSDPFLSGGRCEVEAMEGEDGGELSPSSPLPPHITAEHSYSLCGDSRPQSPLSHLTGEHGSEAGETRTRENLKVVFSMGALVTLMSW